MRSRIGVSTWVYVAALVCASLATQLTFAARHHVLQARADRATQAIRPEAQLPETHSEIAGGRTLNGRPLYPYSVIPGGIQSALELKDAVLRDPVVAAHYADFNIAQAHVVRLDADRAMYVSYRMGDRVFWTDKALMLHKGETLISDGAHEARTRCGNRLSEVSAAPVSPEQPSPNVLAAPEAPVLFTGNFPPSPGFLLMPPSGLPPASPGTPPGGILPPPIIPIVGGGQPPNHPKTPPPPSGPPTIPPGTSPPPGPPAPPPPGPPTTPPGTPPPPGPPTPPPPGPPPPGTPTTPGTPTSPPVTVPEPSTLGLLAAGLFTLLAAIALVSVRKKRKA